MSAGEAITRAEAHVRARLGDADGVTVSQHPAPAGLVAVRAVAPGGYPGTGIAVVLVGAGGELLGAGASEVTDLIDVVGVDVSAAGARRLAELVVLGWLDGLPELLDEPAATLATTADGLRLEAGIRGPLDPTPLRLVVTIPSDGAASIERTPLAGASTTAAVSRADALEQALARGDAMAIQRGLRALTGALDEREMTAVARVAVHATGQLAVQARRRLGQGPAADAALARARRVD